MMSQRCVGLRPLLHQATATAAATIATARSLHNFTAAATTVMTIVIIATIATTEHIPQFYTTSL